MWKRTRDYITSKEEKAEGKTWKDKKSSNWDDEKAKEKTFYKFRLKDDDEEIYLHGISSNDSSFAPCDYFEGLLGTTIIEYWNDNKKEWEML